MPAHDKDIHLVELTLPRYPTLTRLSNMLVPFPDGPCSDYTIYNDYTLAPLVELGLSDIMQASWLQAKLQSLTKTLNTRHIILS
eukprot:scaffold236521_cov17-Tisochrysis_lutea.AAC.1